MSKQSEEFYRLVRKGDQESELGSLAAADGDHQDAAKHFKKAKDYWNRAREMKE